MHGPLRRVGRKSPGREIPIAIAIGTLRWGYHEAARLRDVTITRTRRHATLTGGVESFNRVQTGPNGPVVPTLRALYFVALIKGGAWQWPVTHLEINTRTVRAELGPQET